jgi:hypothetical protein
MIGDQDQEPRGVYSHQMTILCQESRKFDEASLGHLADSVTLQGTKDHIIAQMIFLNPSISKPQLDHGALTHARRGIAHPAKIRISAGPARAALYEPKTWYISSLGLAKSPRRRYRL